MSSQRSQLQKHVQYGSWLRAIESVSLQSIQNYEQAYDYSTDFELRKQQCMNVDGMSLIRNRYLQKNIAVHFLDSSIY